MRVLYPHVSKPLGSILHLPLGLSSNVAAEAMLRETALAYRPHLTPQPRGALSAQEARITYGLLLRELLEGALSAQEARITYGLLLRDLLEVDGQQARLYEGSGLSPNNQVSAMVLMKVLCKCFCNALQRSAAVCLRVAPNVRSLGANPHSTVFCLCTCHNLSSNH